MISNAQRTIWLLLIFAFIFLIFGIISFLNNGNHLLFGVWFLNLIFLILFTYYALQTNPHCQILIYILYLLILLFSTMWAATWWENLDYANISLVLVLIFSLALIYLTHSGFYGLGILYLLLWLFIFFKVNGDQIKSD